MKVKKLPQTSRLGELQGFAPLRSKKANYSRAAGLRKQNHSLTTKQGVLLHIHSWWGEDINKSLDRFPAI